MASRSNAVVLAVALAGCDVVFGVDVDEAVPCGSEAFDAIEPLAIAPAELSAIEWDERFAILVRDGGLAQFALPSGPASATPIDLGAFNNMQLAIAPEGDAMFFTAAIEPPELRGAVRSQDNWRVVTEVPRGTYAGSPSAREFGPRRVLVRLRDFEDVQEYEEVAGRWVPVGEPLALTGLDGPNLTPNGLTAVYIETLIIVGEGGDEISENVQLIHRPTIDAPFSSPVTILSGRFRSPQLLGRCRNLYAIDVDDQVLKRYSR